MARTKLPLGGFKCPQCGTLHKSGCNASGCNNCACERVMCDCGAKKK